MNKKTIKITAIADHGRNHELYCSRVLMLRKARRIGDTETVNHFVLGRLNMHKGADFDFEVIG